MPDPDDLVFVNGINGLTGEHLVVFASDEADAVKRALEPLIEHRRQRVGGESVRHLLSSASTRGSR